MHIQYDAVADILYVDFVERHEGQTTREIGEGLLAEVNLETSVTEGFEIWHFCQKASENGGIDVSLQLPALPLQPVASGA
ncbi:MAG: DUF2283 domain-containing protein [bacterium]